MKTLKVLLAGLSVLAFASTVSCAEEVEKEGFLTTKWCANNGMFTNCRLETVFCGYEGCLKEMKEFKTDINGELVLYVHSEGKSYDLKFPPTIKMYQVLKEALNKNEVTLTGQLDPKGVLMVEEYEAPPPPKKEFFKGCL
jgi:hypothetical protein